MVFLTMEGFSRFVFLTMEGFFRGTCGGNPPQINNNTRQAEEKRKIRHRNVQRPRRANIDGGVRECHTGEAAGLLQSFS